MAAKFLAATMIFAVVSSIVTSCNPDDSERIDATISVEPAGLGFTWNDSSEKYVEVKTNAPAVEVSSSYSWIGAKAQDGRVYVWMKSENTSGESRKGSVQVLALDKKGVILNECQLAVSQESGNEDGPSSGDGQFEDEVFAEYVMENFDYDKDGLISDTEAATVTSMDIDSYGVSSIAGIEIFKNLNSVDLSNNSLKTVDLRGLSKLQYLVVQNCGTENLLLGGCTGLISIIARKNSLASVDLTDQTGIQFLDLGQNKLTSLSISDRADLQYVAVDMNSLAKLSLSGCPKIKTLACHKNSLESLDITSMPVLDWLDCSSNNIMSLDLSSSKEMISLMCNDNLLKSIDLSACSKLKYFSCRSNRIEAMDASHCPLLVKLDCGANPLKSLTCTGCTDLAILSCDNCGLGSLDVTAYTKLTSLICNGNSISSLDVASNLALEILYCQDNGMKTLYMAKNQTINDIKKDPDCEIILK